MELIQPFTDAIAKSLDENLDRTKIQLNFAKLMDTPASEELLSLALRKQLSHRTLSDTFRLFDLALDLESLKLCDSGLAVILIEEASEALILSQLPELFQYLDRKQVEITANMTPQKGKGLVLLRICNELLRRLSKHDRLCGNIRLFLSKAFPLCDRSGVNFRGDYHTDNITVYDTQEPNTLYQCFWRLQMDFSHMPAADPRKTLQVFKS